MPISRVRWVTETSMMLATPTPPTSSEMAAIANVNRARKLMNWVLLDSRSVRVRTL
jgi:hypothetical protein